jgi:O-antigen ligase
MFDKTSELFEFNKLLFIYFSTLTVAFVWGVRMIIEKRIILRRTVLDIPILIYLASQIISTIFSIDIHTSIFGYYGRFNGGLLSVFAFVILFYGFITFIEKKHIALLLNIAVIGALFVFLWGLPARFGHDLTCLVFTGQFNNDCWTSQFKPAERMFSTLGQPNWLGAYFAISFFISIYIVFKQKLTSWKMLFYFLPIIFFAGTLFTKSRSALVAIGICGILLLIYVGSLSGMYKKFREYAKEYIKPAFIIAAILFISVLIFKTGIENIDKYLQFNAKKVTSVEKINPLTEAPTNVTESFDIRKIVWSGAIHLTLQYPLFGTGVETFAYSYNFVRPQEHNLTSEWDYIYNKAHNEYLNYAATTGLFGLLAYVSLLVTFIVWFGSKYFGKLKMLTDSRAKDLHLIFSENLLYCSLFLAWITILITNFFGFSTTIINLFFYLIPGILIIYETKEENLSIKTSSLSLATYAKITTLSIVYLYGVWFLVAYFRADVAYAIGNSFLQSQDYANGYQYILKAETLKKEPVYEDKLSTALSSLALINAYQNVDNKDLMNQQFSTALQLSEMYSKEALDSSTENPYYYRSKAKNYYIFYTLSSDKNLLTKGIDAIHQAEKYSPTDPKNYYTEALFYLLILDSDNKNDSARNNAKAKLEKAILLKPDYRDAHFALATLYNKDGKKEEAKLEYQKVLEIVPQDADAKKALEGLVGSK